MSGRDRRGPGDHGSNRVGVAVLGATGMVGELIVRRLRRHPWFRVDEVAGSPRSVGTRYGDVVELDADDALGDQVLLQPDEPLRSPVVLSALPRAAARTLEPLHAERGRLVCSNASAFRQEDSVPLLIPEINAAAIRAVADQPWARDGGALVTNPNCMVAGLALTLAPLRQFGIRAVTVVTMQALSGAGRHGLAATSTHGNVIPHIDGEADKVGPELTRILDADFPVSVSVNRVPVLHGHLASLFVKFDAPVPLAAASAAMTGYRATRETLALPTAAAAPLRVLSDNDRPQPRLDLDAGDGMVVSVGGLRRDPVYDLACSVLVHNLVRGAAGACILNAELAVQQLGYRATPGDDRTPPSRPTRRPRQGVR